MCICASIGGNTTTNVDENIKKARRSAYGLFSSGFHGYNGLDVDTMLHLYKIYILPVLLYGLELILPQGPQLEPYALLLAFFMFSSTFVVVFPLSEVVLIIPRCTALSTKGMLLLPY
jgi:hypothetical protein